MTAQSIRARNTGESESLKSFIKRRYDGSSLSEIVCKLVTSVTDSSRTVTTYFYLISGGLVSQQPTAKIVRDIRTGRILDVLSSHGRAPFLETRRFARNNSGGM